MAIAVSNNSTKGPQNLGIEIVYEDDLVFLTVTNDDTGDELVETFFSPDVALEIRDTLIEAIEKAGA